MANTLLFIGGIGGLEVIILLLLLGSFGWLWALIDLLTSNFKNSFEKLIWLVLIIFVPVLGPILYLFIGRKQKVKNNYQ